MTEPEKKEKKKSTTKKSNTKENSSVSKKNSTKKAEVVKEKEELSATMMYPVIDDKTQELHLSEGTKVHEGLAQKLEEAEEKRKEKEMEEKKELEITQRIPKTSDIPARRKSILDRFYFGSGERIVVYIILIGMFIASGISLLLKAYSFSEGETINYKESYSLDYRVNLKPNDFYTESSLGKNMTYVSSLISTIDVSFDYKFNIDKESKIKYTYYTYATLAISDSSGKEIFTKDYQLSEPEELLLNNGKNAKISKKVNIDYGYYNNLASQFKTTYGITSNSKLKVYLKIMKTNENNDITLSFSESDPFSLEIPLSEKTININMNYNDVNENNEVLSKPAYNVVNKRDLVMAYSFLVLAVCTIIFMIRFIVRIQVKKSEYDRFIEKVLREYDRLIVNTVSKPNLHGDKVVKLKEFNELLDVRDTLQLPIMYYEVTKHQKCYFYINQNNSVYVLTVKAIDLENK